MARQNRTHLDDPEAFGRRLREARLAAGLRLVDLEFDGCSIGYLSHLEHGKRVPSLQVVRELARLTGVSEEWLARGSNAMQAAADLLTQAEVAARLGEVARARSILCSALRVAATDAQRGRARAGLADLILRDGDAHAAVAEFEAALALDPALEDDPGFADSFGRAYARSGDQDSAIALFTRRVAASRSSGDVVNAQRFSVLLANALIDTARLDEASRLLSELITELADGDPLALARLHWSQSRLHALRHDHVNAASYARSALAVLEATDYLQQRVRAHQLLAYVENDAGHAAEALALVERARGLGVIAAPFDEATLDIEEARARARLGERERAADLAMRASQVLVDNHPIDAGRCYAEIAAACAQAGEMIRASELGELAVEFLERGGPNPFLPEALAQYADVLEQLGERERAFAVYKRAALGRAELGRRGVSST